MASLQDNIKNHRFSIMQLRARGLPSKRQAHLHNEIDRLQDHLLTLNQVLANKGLEIENLVAQRDEYGRRLNNLCELNLKADGL